MRAAVCARELGVVKYGEALQLQERLVADRKAGHVLSVGTGQRRACPATARHRQVVTAASYSYRGGSREPREKNTRGSFFTATEAQLFLGLILGLHRLEAFHPAATTPPRSTLFLGSPWDMHWTKSQRGAHQNAVMAWITHISDPPTILRDTTTHTAKQSSQQNYIRKKTY
jgi:hypothetical protein